MSLESSSSDVAAEQARQNRTTQSQWLLYASHRREIERLIVPESPGGHICVLGAGNCNDLDLKWLAQVYREVHLVDLDDVALRSAVERQGLGDSSDIHCHAPVDLSGIADVVASWSHAAPSVDQIDAATRRVLEAPPAPWGQFDVVLSPCVLTQMLNSVRNALRATYPPSHPARARIHEALRLRHLRTIAASLAPGGRGVLVIDLISTETLAELPRVPRDELGSLMRTFIADGKSYPGLDPAALSALWRENPILRSRVGPLTFSEPWHWHLGLRKSFLAYAATMRAQLRVREIERFSRR